jgi:hypothetical protein
VEQFVGARHVAKTSPEEMVKICHELLDTVRIYIWMKISQKMSSSMCIDGENHATQDIAENAPSYVFIQSNR